ncbi:MAG: polysaccharide deacetylase family protein, partial [Candidatus Nitrosopolaris sp.]
MSNLDGNTTFGIVVVIIAMMLIIDSSSFLNMALSKPSSWRVPLPTSGGISINSNGGNGSSNLNRLYKQFTSTYLFTPLSSAYTSGGNNTGAGNSNKAVMIGFDDGWKSQITYAKPILDKYGLKASFFVVCNYANSGNIRRMNWQDIASLQQDGMDIESHTMDHKPLSMLSWNGLLYEIAGSKQCLANHGINSSIFAYPFNQGSNIPSVVDIVSKYYSFARTGTF